MKRSRIAALVAVAGALAVAPPVAAQDGGVDVGQICEDTIGPSETTFDLRPVALAKLWTCSAADFDH